jgi:hypothetical protein
MPVDSFGFRFGGGYRLYRAPRGDITQIKAPDWSTPDGVFLVGAIVQNFHPDTFHLMVVSKNGELSQDDEAMFAIAIPGETIVTLSAGVHLPPHGLFVTYPIIGISSDANEYVPASFPDHATQVYYR